MSKIKMTFIDKDRWGSELDLLYLKENIDYETSQKFINVNNVVGLDEYEERTTICSKSNLNNFIEKKIGLKTKAAVIINFELSLEDIFSNIMQTVMATGIDIFIVDKSPFPIRNNVAMTIDLNEYDTNTDFNSVKHILETNLKESLEQAKKSKNPKHVNDLGIQLEEESNKIIFESLASLFGTPMDIEPMDADEYDMLLDEFDKFNDFYDEELIRDEISVKINKNQNIELSDGVGKIILNKNNAIKICKILEALLYE